ncbi:hypothetical protein BSKO_08828 [Bryopsis sp. KO-2023]|nr:hypothetical protein BSKO_08828 [Bryopsis sp. KO-2023]
MAQESSEIITPETVLALEGPTDGYLCPMSANNIGLEFMRFEIRDCDSGELMLKISSKPSSPMSVMEGPGNQEPCRAVSYCFPLRFLRMKNIRTLLNFGVGADVIVNSLKMIERHYFKGELIRSFSFDFGFCIPGSENSWEGIYDLPQKSEEEIDEFEKSPGEHQSDSFYFADDRLIMHNKAFYEYRDGESWVVRQ